MGIFGSGGGTLGLGGTSWDPNTWDLDIDLDPSDITVTDPTINWPPPRPYKPPGLLNPFGDDPAGDIQDQLDAAEDSVNDFVGDTMDTGQGNLEGLLEDNNDTLLDMGGTFDYNVDQANAFVDNTVAVLLILKVGMMMHLNHKVMQNYGGIGQQGRMMTWQNKVQQI